MKEELVDRWLDELARAAAGGGVSRRTVVRRLLPGFLAGLVGGGALLRGTASADAPLPPSQPHTQPQPQPQVTQCGPNDNAICNGACVDLESDPNNCGHCGLVCRQGSCFGGQCQCAPGQLLCNGLCTST